jgi:hypothetical protein
MPGMRSMPNNFDGLKLCTLGDACTAEVTFIQVNPGFLLHNSNRPQRANGYAKFATDTFIFNHTDTHEFRAPLDDLGFT